jgi:hypothetical protein
MKIKILRSVIFILTAMSMCGLGINEYATGATISGHVFAKDGTTGIANVQVSAFGAAGPGCADWHNGISTDSNGYYALTVDPGTYYIFADASFFSCQPYANEYWNDTGGTSLCEEAAAVAADTSGIDFVLADGYLIQGTVYKSDQATPIQNAHVAAFGTSGPDCGDWYGGTATDANGDYCLNLPAGTYRVFADASLNVCQPYIDEYYSTTGGTNLCEEATPVTAGGPRIDFALADGFIISGNVSSNKDGTLIEQVQMVLYTDQACDGIWYGGSPTDENGDYCVTVPPNTYYIYAEASHHFSQNYTDEWWSSGSGTLKCSGAEGVTISDAHVPDIDFALDPKKALTPILMLLGE